MGRPYVYADYETKCDLSLPDVGRVRYLNHISADIKCLAWAIGNNPTQLWLPGQPIPGPFLRPSEFAWVAHNIQFDQGVTNTLGIHYGMREWPLDNCIDTMAIAARFGLPQDLHKLGLALDVTMPKLKTGRALLKKVCLPPYEYTKQELIGLQDYCIRDVDCLRQVHQLLPAQKLGEKEFEIWKRSCEMNARGVPIDYPSVLQINKVVNWYIKKQTTYLPYYTGGAVDKVGQIKRIRAWLLEDYDIDLPNLQQQTVSDYLSTGGHIPKAVRKVLRIRQLIGGAAVKKFNRLENMTHHERIYDNSRYHGAGTGRTTGSGFQMLNMPRAKQKGQDGRSYEDQVEHIIGRFHDASIVQEEDPMWHAKTLVRPMLKTRKGKRLVVVDWSSIEYILLMWFCGETAKVRAFEEGEDQYIRFASKLFNVPYRLVTKEQRQHAKPPVLGAGYTLGWRGLIGYAEGYGISMSEEEAKFGTNTFRRDHPKVVSAWGDLENVAHCAIRQPGRIFESHRTKFCVIKDGTGCPWLTMMLPSGRKLYYREPTLGQGKYGEVIYHMGVDPYTKQWGKKRLNLSRVIENAIQALGRDVLTAGEARLERQGFTIIGGVYDEIVCEEDEENADQRLFEMRQWMCHPPEWAPDLPLKAEGYTSRRYRKD